MMKTIFAVALALMLCAPPTDAQDRERSRSEPRIGMVEITVVDEDDRVIPDVHISINGVRYIGQFSHRKGKAKVTAKKSGVGEMTSEINIKGGEINKFALKFFRLRETVTSVTTIPGERYHGTILFLNCLPGETDVVVDRLEGGRTDAFDGRIIKGSGSLKISNLATGTYELAVTRNDGTPVPGCERACKTEVSVERNKQTVLIKAEDGRVGEANAPLACGSVPKRAGAK